MGESLERALASMSLRQLFTHPLILPFTFQARPQVQKVDEKARWGTSSFPFPLLPSSLPLHLRPRQKSQPLQGRRGRHNINRETFMGLERGFASCQTRRALMVYRVRADCLTFGLDITLIYFQFQLTCLITHGKTSGPHLLGGLAGK